MYLVTLFSLALYRAIVLPSSSEIGRLRSIFTHFQEQAQFQGTSARQGPRRGDWIDKTIKRILKCQLMMVHKGIVSWQRTTVYAWMLLLGLTQEGE